MFYHQKISQICLQDPCGCHYFLVTLFLSLNILGRRGFCSTFSDLYCFLTHYCNILFLSFQLRYPISTLPEHLHSISLSYAETTLNSRKLVSFPLYRSLPVSRSPTPPFTGRPGHTHTYPSFLVSAPSKPVVLLVALTCCVCFALKALKLPVFSFELTLLIFSVSYLWIISYIYIYIRSAFYLFL